MRALRTVIVEDEIGAANQLTSLLKSIYPNIAVVTILRGVEEAVEWITSSASPDLAFFDIQLEDGLSFEIFKRCEVRFPVVFTTAYDQYAIEAFKVNSIDYLLKPIKEADLRFSIKKYEAVGRTEVKPLMLDQLADLLDASQKTFTLLIRVKDRLIPVKENEFAYFFLENGIVKGCTLTRQTFSLDQTIEELATRLNNKNFFRANRQVVVNRAAIQEAEYYFNGRLALKLLYAPAKPVLISKARVPVFKNWWATGSSGL
ncbi:MAG TPA: LytTR family DNA-binding domain-containing protein [Chryseolinea sp.]